MPFWLSSLILHLVCFLLITSMTCPWSGMGQMGSSGISLTISFGDADQSRGQDAVVIAAETPDRESTPAPQPVTPEPPATPTRELAQQPPRGTTPQRSAAQPSGASQDQAARDGECSLGSRAISVRWAARPKPRLAPSSRAGDTLASDHRLE